MRRIIAALAVVLALTGCTCALAACGAEYDGEVGASDVF